MSFFDSTLSILLPFIVLIFFTLMVDGVVLELQNFLEKIASFFSKRVKIARKFAWWVAHLIVVVIAYFVAREANWDFYSYFDVTWNHPWQAHLASALTMSAGSAFVKTSFTYINSIPYVLGNTASSVKKMVTGNVEQPAVDPYTYDMDELEEDPNRHSD